MANLLRKPLARDGLVHAVIPENAGWRYVGFELHRLASGAVASGLTQDREAILVMVEGRAQVQAAGQDWGVLGDRMDVFEKTAPHCLYIPPAQDWQVTATTDCTLAICCAPAKGGYPARRLGPDGITLTQRGDGSNTRWINNIAMEDADVAESLLITEVFTPAGNWSSYPSHRHDEDDYPRITYLEEGDIAVLTRTSLEIRDLNGELANRPIKTIQIEAAQVDKAGHKHFMAKEIDEQPRVIGEALRFYLSGEGDTIRLPGDGMDFTTIDRLSMVACGTAFYACMTAKYWFEQLAGLPVDVDIASEFRYREPPIPARTVALFVSQSGETADTLAALRFCADKAAAIVSVINVPESSIARESDLALPIMAGAEIGVASTKAFTCQLTVLLLLALEAAHQRGRISNDELSDHLSALRALPVALNAALDLSGRIKQAARKLSESSDVLFLGRGLMYPLALEGALKL